MSVPSSIVPSLDLDELGRAVSDVVASDACVLAPFERERRRMLLGFDVEEAQRRKEND
jgi:hypothetical protein